jgi:rhamnosyltransferase subunit B
MKFLLVTLGSIGDLMPFLALADALRHRGHSAVIASHAGYAALVRGSGFDFAIVSERPLQALDSLIASDPDQAWEAVQRDVFVPATRPVRDFIAHHAQLGPCKVIASWNAFGAAIARKELGVPLCRIFLSPHPLHEDSDAAGERLGLFPSWFAPEVQGIRTCGFPMLADAAVPALPAGLAEFLRAGSPPVLFTPGSFMRQASGFFRHSLAVCEQLDLRAVFLTPYGDQVPARLPSTIRHFPFVSLQRLAPFGAALVHHGGIGTCAQALRAGIPQLVAPVFFDQPDNAVRLEKLGVGRRLPSYGQFEVAARVRELLTSQAVGEACASVRARFAGPDPMDGICDAAESLT